MADNIVAENSNLVYGFASRSQIPFEKINWVQNAYSASQPLFACSGDFQKDASKALSYSVNSTQSMRQCRIGLGFFQVLLSALVFGDHFNHNYPLKKKKDHQPHRKKHAKTILY